MNYVTHLPRANAMDLWGIDELTARADVSRRLVQHCEARGLIAGGAAGASARRYTERDVRVLRFVRHAHVLGLGMSQAAQVLSLWWDMRRARAAAERTPTLRADASASRIDGSLDVVRDYLAALGPAGHLDAGPILEELAALDAGGQRGDADSLA